MALTLKRLFRRSRVGLVIAGGGCKAFFGLGVATVLQRKGIKIRAISATSAGSAMALSLVSGVTEEVIDYFCSITFQNESNFYFSKLLSLKRPFPHEEMYRSTIANHINIEKIRKTDIQFFFNSLKVNEQLNPEANRAAYFKLIARLYNAYNREFKLFERDGKYEPLLRQIVEEVGLEEVVFTNKDLSSKKQIEDIILAASSAPPLVELQQMSDGHYYLDGGIYDNLPIVNLPDDIDVVIAVYYEPLTRFLYEHRKDERFEKTIFIKPPGKLPITTWDYTNPYGVRATYEMGKRAGEMALKRIKAAV